MKTMLLVISLAFLAACSSTPEGKPAGDDAAATPAETVAAVADAIVADDDVDMGAAYAAFNAGDWAGATAEFDEQTEWHIPGGRQPLLKGATAIAKTWASYGALDAKLTAARVLEAGDVTIVQGTILGTHVGEFMGAAATQTWKRIFHILLFTFIFPHLLCDTTPICMT